MRFKDECLTPACKIAAMTKVNKKIPTKDERNVDVKTRRENSPLAVSFKVARFAIGKHKNVDDAKTKCQSVMEVAAGSVLNKVGTKSERLIQIANDRINTELGRALQLRVLDYNTLPLVSAKIDPRMEEVKAAKHYMLRRHKAMMLIDLTSQKLKKNLEKNS